MKEVINTACPRNCYSGCSFKVVVENDRILSLEPQPLNKSTSEGPCIKGISHIERVYSPDRILEPLIRSNEGYKKISWDRALEIIAQKLTYYKEKASTHSIFYYSASGMAGLLNSVGENFWKLYGGVTTSYGDLCWPAGLEATRLTFGDIKHNAPWDLENAKLIVLWGKNPVESNVQEVVFIEAARKKGATVVLIDPRRSRSAIYADIHIQPKPGTDGLLALAIAKIIIEEDWIDMEFINNHVKGFHEFRMSLEGIDLDRVYNICGVPHELIISTAKYIGKHKPMTIVPGYGMQRYSNGGQTMRCIMSLQVITGNIGKTGACWHYANLQSYVFDTLKEPLSLYPDIADDGINRRIISRARLGDSLIESDAPEIKMAWIERANPVTQNPDSKKTIKALRNIDFVVVVDQFLTDTAREADIILPAKTMFEQSDILGSYWNPYIRLRQKVIDPPGGVKPESEIYYYLGKKLGYSDEQLSEIMPLPGDDNTEAWLGKFCKQMDGLSLDILKEGPVMAPGNQDIAYEDYVFNTPSGKIELLSAEAHNRWGVDVLPEFIQLKEFGGMENKYPLHLLSPVTKNRIHSQFGNLKSISDLHPEPYMEISPLDASIRNINDGDKAHVYNKRGKLYIKVKYNYSMRPGVVSIYNGYWITEGTCPNWLSKGRETDMGYGAAFHDNMVEVELADNE